jgi:hypothetical protein
VAEWWSKVPTVPRPALACSAATSSWRSTTSRSTGIADLRAQLERAEKRFALLIQRGEARIFVPIRLDGPASIDAGARASGKRQAASGAIARWMSHGGVHRRGLPGEFAASAAPTETPGRAVFV